MFRHLEVFLCAEVTLNKITSLNNDFLVPKGN